MSVRFKDWIRRKHLGYSPAYDKNFLVVSKLYLFPVTFFSKNNSLWFEMLYFLNLLPNSGISSEWRGICQSRLVGNASWVRFQIKANDRSPSLSVKMECRANFFKCVLAKSSFGNLTKLKVWLARIARVTIRWGHVTKHFEGSYGLCTLNWAEKWE